MISWGSRSRRRLAQSLQTCSSKLMQDSSPKRFLKQKSCFVATVESGRRLRAAGSLDSARGSPLSTLQELLLKPSLAEVPRIP